MLPDWAVIDVRQGADSQLPGVVSVAGFFDERWLLPQNERPELEGRGADQSVSH